ncbi:MAG: FAD-dependent oxidoreductase [Dehalococcoidia bacterium]|nr:FAD-dependent oxidoreductase [Dehalococcoidia bacterium]
MIVSIEKCIACERCVKACPLQVISLQERKASVSEDCVNCGTCKKVCPVEALVFEEVPFEESLQCISCPVHCQIRPGRTGACQRFSNVEGDLVRNVPLCTFEDVAEIVGQEHERCIRKPLVTAIGAGTTYPDFKPAPCIVQSSVDNVDVVTAVTEAPLSYSGMLVKIDTDEYIGAEGAAVFIDEDAIAPCKEACPAGIDVPRYIRLIGEGKFAEALAVVREKIPFPSVCGHVCFHPCETECLRKELGGPLAIRALKRFVAERDDGLWKTKSRVAAATGKRIAIAGSGPAGLTAAYYLAKQGNAVTVFEQLPVAGGMMRVGIPDYRLPQEILQREIAEVENVGVEIKTNTKIESIDALFDQGYDAIFLAMGAHKGMRLGIEGENSPGVMQCIPFLREVKLGRTDHLDGKVLIVGGGNAAIDASRTALRLGAEDVTVVYRRSRVEMPASEDEVEEALREGVSIQFLSTPTRIEKRDEHLSMECTRIKLGEVDASGRRRPEPVPGSEFNIDAATVILAIGERPDVPEQFGLKQGRGDTLEVAPETMATERAGVFAGGDLVTGPASVIEAIAAGRKAAISMDRYLGGTGMIAETLAPQEGIPLPLNVLKPPEEKRLPAPSLPLKERPGNFSPVERSYSAETAVKEAQRCLRCDLENQVKVGYVTTEQYGAEMLSLGGPVLLTEKGGGAIVRLMVALANQEEVALKVDGGASLKLQVGKPPRINGKIIERMRVGCGSACAGLFAYSFREVADEVIVIDHHITSLFTAHEAGQALDVKPSGLKLKGMESTPGRYFHIADPGSGWGGTSIEDPLDVIESIDLHSARPGMRVLITESTGGRAAMYEMVEDGKLHQIELTPGAREVVREISDNCESSMVSAVFVGGTGGSARGGITKHPVRLTRAVHENKARLTVGGAPVCLMPGGGIDFFVDVSKVKVHAFTWVPTPAVVFPVEYTMRLQDYLNFGGHKDSIRTLDEVKQDFKGKE